MKPMQLPDLVLGVRIEADVTGTRQAITKLQRSINQQTGIVAGGSSGGRGGGFLGAAVGGGFAASMLGTRSALAGVKSLAAVQKAAGNRLMKELREGKITEDKAALGMLHLMTGISGIEGSRRYMAWGGDKRLLQLTRMAKAYSAGGAARAAAGGAKGAAGGLGSAAAGAGFAGLFQRMLKFAGLGKFSKMVGMARFGVVGAILAALLASIWAFVKSLKAAVAYIRQSIVNDKVFRPFVNQLDEFGRMWTNLWRQTGLMLITVLPLTEALAAFTNVLKIWGTIIAGITPFLKTMASLNFNFTVLRFIADLYSKLPGGSGGISLPMGSKMAPGALEGSVEAYRSIYGGADYLAKIADNTFDTKQALRNLGKGFVIGVIGG
jgi:hypothetical protein